MHWKRSTQTCWRCAVSSSGGVTRSFLNLHPSGPFPHLKVTTAQEAYRLPSPGDCHAANGSVGREGGRRGDREGGGGEGEGRESLTSGRGTGGAVRAVHLAGDGRGELALGAGAS